MNSTRKGCCSAASVAMLPETKNATAESSREKTERPNRLQFSLVVGEHAHTLAVCPFIAE